MTDRVALERLPAEPAREELAALEQRVADRTRALETTRRELQHLQSRYLDAVAVYYRQLVELDAETRALEVRLGLRDPAEVDVDADAPADDAGDACGNRGAPSTDLR